MIVVKFTGGLGNQMFQYALFLALQEKYRETLVLADISAYYVLDLHYGFELDKIFSLSRHDKLKIASNRQLYIARGEIPFFTGGIIGKMVQRPVCWINARLRRLAEIKGKRNVIREEDVMWKNDCAQLNSAIENLDITKNWYLDGYWQREIFFEHILKKMKGNCVFPKLKTEQEMEIEKRIVSSNSVSIHVRRGDYVNSQYDILGMKYYKNAIDYISGRVKSPLFFIFSEDDKYIEEAFSGIENKVIVSFNKDKNSYKDMQMMSMCKHNIIANSSFSTWAAYLNNNEDKIVIYPSRYTETEKNVKRNGWIEMDV